MAKGKNMNHNCNELVQNANPESLLMVPMEMTPLFDTKCASTVDFKMEMGIAYFDSKHD